MKKEYDAIWLGGNKHLHGGRIIAGHRLRTAGRKEGYDTFVIDTASSMSQFELMTLLESVVTSKTLMLGFSFGWMDTGAKDKIEWVNDDFFNQLKTKFPHARVVGGGPGAPWLRDPQIVYKNCDWSLMGFSDLAYPKLLDMFSGKTNHGLKYFVDTDSGKKIVQSDINHKLYDPNEIETVFELDDNFLPHQPLPLEVSRGCIFRCSFCGHPFQGLKDYDSYQRKPENLANELRRNYELFGTTRYALMDDTFNDSIEKLDRLLKAIEIAKLPDFKFMSYLKPELLVTKPEMIDKLKQLGVTGAFFGIESIFPIARKAIKKGMDFERVAEAIKIFKQRTNAKIKSSFITGLPGDSIESQWQTVEYMIKNKDDFCADWSFKPLTMYVDKYGKGVSEIDRNPEKFGYEIIRKAQAFPESPGHFLIWKNEFMDRDHAGILIEELNHESNKHTRPGGWLIPTAWHFGLSDDDIENKTLRELNLWGKGPIFERQRAIEFLEKHTHLRFDSDSTPTLKKE
jgi:radical SAM superfamily enzyme YgiQ (UPF0313 family)